MIQAHAIMISQRHQLINDHTGEQNTERTAMHEVHHEDEEAALRCYGYGEDVKTPLMISTKVNIILLFNRLVLTR